MDEKSAKSYDRPSEKCAASHEYFAPKIQSGMLRNVGGQQDAHMPRAGSIAFEAPLVASPNQAMRAIQVSRKKLYELINTGELESYTEGKSRRITVPSLEKFSGGITPSQTVPATLQHYAQGSTIIPSSTLLENVMRKPRDFDGELKALQDKARDLKSRKVQQLGELVIATGADSLNVDELAGALIVLTETKDAGKREAWARRGAAFFQSRARRTAPAAERHTGGARAQPGGAQPSTGSKGAA